MERILHFTVGSRPKNDQLQIIEIAKTLHPTWEVKVWQDPVDTDGFLLAKYHKNAGHGAQLSDLIRLDVVYRYGGIYLDSDVRLLKPLDDLCCHENFFCSEDGYNLTNAVFGASKHSPAIKAIIDKLLAEEPDWSAPGNVTTGPVVFARVLKWRKDVVLLPRETFYPYNWNEPPRPPLITSFGVHEWANSWFPKEIKSQFIPTPPTRLRAVRNKATALARRFISKAASVTVEEYEKRRPPFGRAYSFGADLVAETNRQIMMSLPGDDLSITPSIALQGTYEEPELHFVEKTLRGGDFFVDVGCNVGVFTLVAARKVGPCGRVFAFDPNDGVVKHLRRSLVMNWVHDRVKVFECAVGEEEKAATLRYSQLSVGGGSLGIDEDSAFKPTVAEIGNLVEKQTHVIALDHLFLHPLEIKILKIDVEGFEHTVLEGARRLLKEKSINYLILELLEEIASKRYKQNVNAVVEVMNLGYRLCRLDKSGNLIRCASIRDAIAFSRNLVLERE